MTESPLVSHFAMASSSQEHNRAFPHDHPNPTYLRFGDWPADERSMNHITGHKEEGVSVYDLDKHGQPMDPDYDMDRGEHYEGCGGPEHCDLWEHDPENTEMHDDTADMVRGHIDDCMKGHNTQKDRRAHLVQGEWAGFGHDDEPVIQKVKAVGHWPCDVHKFVPGAEKVQPSWCYHPDHDEDEEDEDDHHLGGLADRHVTCDQGHQHWGSAGAAGLLIRHTDSDGQKRYLLQHRADWVDHPGTWGIPSGALKEGEEPIIGAAREGIEEMGGLPQGLTHVGTNVDDHGGWAFHTAVFDSPEQWKPPRTTGEASEHRWVTPDEMKDLDLHPGFEHSWTKTLSKQAEVTPEGIWDPAYVSPETKSSQHSEILRAHLAEHHPDLLDRPEAMHDALHRAAHTAEGQGWGSGKTAEDPSLAFHTHDPLIDPSTPRRQRLAVQDRPDPDPVEYRHHPPRDPYSEGRPSGHHTMNAFLEGTQIGRLSWWDPGDGPYKDNSSFGPKVDKVEVASDHRRKGLGAEMMRRAREITPGIRHSDRLTGDGRAWRNAVSPEEAGDPAYAAGMANRLGAKETHSIYRGLYLGGDTKARSVPPAEGEGGIGHLEDYTPDYSDQGILDDLARHHQWRLNTDQISGPDHPAHDRLPMYGSHWTENQNLAKQFALDSSHGRWRNPGSPKRPTTGVVLEAQTSTPPENDRLGSQFGESEVHWPGRSAIDKVLVHVHRYDPEVHGKDHRIDTHVRTFEVPAEHLEKHSSYLVTPDLPYSGERDHHEAGLVGGDPGGRQGLGGPSDPDQDARSWSRFLSGLRRLIGDLDDEGSLSPLTWHRAAQKEFKRLDKPSQKAVQTTLDALQRKDPNLQTHPLYGDLKGWYSTKASRGHRIVHQPTDDGGIYVGGVSLHEYPNQRFSQMARSAARREALHSLLD